MWQKYNPVIVNWLSAFHLQMIIDGKTVAGLDRNKAVNVSLPALSTQDSHGSHVTLDILVEGIGRDNSGSKFDLKGLVSEHVLLDGNKPSDAQLCDPDTSSGKDLHFFASWR